MDMFAYVYTSIRAKLAYTYWRAELARVPVQDAKIDTTNIAWGMTPLVLWNNILIRAIRERKINNLLDCAVSRHDRTRESEISVFRSLRGMGS